MNEILEPRKEPLLSAELYKQNPLWFRGAVAHRLLRIMTPKPLSRRLPVILRQPVFYPAFFFPADWIVGDPLPPGITLPPGVSLPPDWRPGDPLPEGTIIDTSIYYPEGWEPGDPPPEGSLENPASFTDIPGVASPVPPIYTSPSEVSGPPRASSEYEAHNVWRQKFDNNHWKPWDSNVEWNASLNRWEALHDNLFLEVIGSWADGYRPTILRVTHLGTDQTDILIEDKDGDNIGLDANSPSLTEVTLTYDTPAAADDIFWLSVMGDDPHILNIEFFEP